MEKSTNHKLLNLTADLVFKTFFKENPSLLKALLKDFLPFPKDSEIAEIELLDAEENPKEISVPQEKTFIFDLKVRLIRKEQGKDIGSETVNVEVQTVAKKNFTDRLLAYSGRIYSGQVKSGQDYNKLHPVYSLVFTTVNLKEFEEIKDEYCHLCKLQRCSPPYLVLSEGIQFIVVELAKFVKGLEKVLDQRDAWCYLFNKAEGMDEADCKALAKKGEIMGEAVRKLWNLSQDELVRERLEAIEKQRRDRQAEIDYAREEGMEKGIEKGIEKGMEKGIEKGIEKGMEKGIEKGIEKGMEKGIEKGMEKGIEKGMEKGIKKGMAKGMEKGQKETAKKIALMLFKKGLDLDTIRSSTGLPKKELEKLSKDSEK